MQRLLNRQVLMAAPLHPRLPGSEGNIIGLPSALAGAPSGEYGYK